MHLQSSLTSGHRGGSVNCIRHLIQWLGSQGLMTYIRACLGCSLCLSAPLPNPVHTYKLFLALSQKKGVLPPTVLLTVCTIEHRDSSDTVTLVLSTNTRTNFNRKTKQMIPPVDVTHLSVSYTTASKLLVAA